MKTWLEVNYEGGRIERREVTPEGHIGRVKGACPGCGEDPCLIQCHGAERVDDRTVRAGSECIACHDPIGWVYHKPSTIFGVEEDMAMLHGRPRVY